MTRFLLLSDICGFVDVGRHLSREDGSIIYNWCLASPADILGSESFKIHDYTCILLINFRLAQPRVVGGQVLGIDIPRKSVAKLYLQALGFRYLLLLLRLLFCRRETPSLTRRRVFHLSVSLQ
jgi:hypothetical protein